MPTVAEYKEIEQTTLDISLPFKRVLEKQTHSAEIAATVLKRFDEMEKAVKPSNSPEFAARFGGMSPMELLNANTGYITLKQKLGIVATNGGALDVQDMALFRHIESDLKILSDQHPTPKDNGHNNVSSSFRFLEQYLAEKGLFLGKDAHHMLNVTSPSPVMSGHADIGITQQIVSR